MVQINLVLLGRPVAGLVEIAESRCFNSRNAGSGVAQPVRKPKKNPGFWIREKPKSIHILQDYFAGISQDFAEVAPALARRGYSLAVVFASGLGKRFWWMGHDHMMDGTQTRYQQDSVGWPLTLIRKLLGTCGDLYLLPLFSNGRGGSRIFDWRSWRSEKQMPQSSDSPVDRPKTWWMSLQIVFGRW